MARGKKPTAITLARDKAIEKAGGIEAAYALVESCMTMKQACAALGLETTAVSAHALRQLFKRDAARWEAAKSASVDALAEQAGEMFGDTAPVTSADAKWRSDRSGYVRWLAEVRAGLREKGGVTVNVQTAFQQLHLDMSRKYGKATHTRTQRGPADAAAAFLQANPVVEAEVVTDE